MSESTQCIKTDIQLPQTQRPSMYKNNAITFLYGTYRCILIYIRAIFDYSGALGCLRSGTKEDCLFCNGIGLHAHLFLYIWQTFLFKVTCIAFSMYI